MKTFIKKMILFLVASCCFFSITACGEQKPDICMTCQGVGVIDCPNCHVKECTWSSGELRCSGGRLKRTCSCGTREKLCEYCEGFGYLMAGSLYLGDCTFCVGGWIKSDCSICNGNGYIMEGSCPNCIDGYIGGKKCKGSRCYIDYRNEGYSYIFCPDC